MADQFYSDPDLSHKISSSQYKFSLWAWENKKCVDIYINYGERQSVMNAILEASGQTSLSWKTVMSKFIRYADLQVKTRKFQVCPGHMAFSNWYGFSENAVDLNSNFCSICLSPPQQISYQGRNLFNYIPLKPRLERMFMSPDYCEKLYGYNFDRQPGIWKDFYDAKCFGRIVNQYGGYD